MTTRVAPDEQPVREVDRNGRHLRVEPSPRWVRGTWGGETIVDSKRVLLVLADRRPPTYYFPTQDILLEHFQPSERVAKLPVLGETHFWHLGSGNDRIENAAFTHTDLIKELAPLQDHVAIKWQALDHWYEENEEVFVHARNPYTRVDAIQSSRRVRVAIDGQTVADSERPVLLFETGLPTRYYLPKGDVRMDMLKPSDSQTSCPYKGTASYWNVTIRDKEYPDIVWEYPDPLSESGKVKDLLCFYNEKVDIYVDGELQLRPKTPWS
jgi:uncharacterized protein (DUF427 family)